MLEQRQIYRALVIAKWICLAMLLMPGFSYKKTADGSQSSIQLGWPSTWIRYDSVTIEKDAAQPEGVASKSVESHSRLTLSVSSWSLLIGVFGTIVFHIAARSYRPEPVDTGPSDTPTHDAGGDPSTA
jgi:hypothetical protein